MASNKLKEEQHFTSGKSVESGEEFSFFYGNKSAFSQWHKAKFTVDGTEYNCAEQYMMHQKAGEYTAQYGGGERGGDTC